MCLPAGGRGRRGWCHNISAGRYEIHLEELGGCSFPHLGRPFAGGACGAAPALIEQTEAYGSILGGAAVGDDLMW